MAELKTYIRGVDLDKRVRSELVFSDATKIRMYDDFQRPGVRLKSTFNKWSGKNEFPTDSDITVRLPSWSPQAVKGWVAFQEVSEKPDGTAVTWRVSDGTDDYWAKPNWPSDLAILAHFNGSYNLDYYRDGVVPTVEQIGNVAIVEPGVSGFGSGALRLIGQQVSVRYSGTQLSAVQNTGTVRFRVKPNYSGNPDYDQTFFFMYEAAGGKNAVVMGHDSFFGKAIVFLSDGSGNVIYYDGPVWNPTAGQWYEFELVWDLTPVTGFGHVLRIDGVEVSSDTTLGSRSTLTDTYGAGSPAPSDICDSTIDEVKVFDTVQHTSDYTPETSEYEPSRTWTVVTPLDTEWNTEKEVSANIGTFPFGQRTIQPIARLTTTDVNETPVLRSFSLAVLAQFDYWEDLVLRSLVPRLRADFQFIADFAATLPRTTDHFNVKDGNTDFTPEKDWDIVGIDAVYDDTNDPGHDVDLFGSYDASTGKVTLTGTLTTGTVVFIRLKLQPDIIVNFAHVDYIEVANTPAVVIENMNVKGRKVEAFREIVDRAAEKGYRLQKPFHADTVTFMCSMLVGSIRDSLRMLSTSMDAILAGEQSGQLPCVLNTVALDERVTMYYDAMARYNPRPNFSHLMTSTFGIVLKDFYVWSESVKETHIVKEFKFSPIIDADVDGPEPIGDPKPLNAGVIPFLLNEPDFEDG